MKVIFSRKGFDSKYGGMPSPIMPGGALVPLPIPSAHDDTTLDYLSFADPVLNQVICDLSGGRYSLRTRVHLDPDLGNKRTEELVGWRPALGQTGAAQSHLKRHGIKSGDVFLFFGWFRRVESAAGKWRFVPKSPNLHVIFGWLEVDKVESIVTCRNDVLSRYPWIAAHPHAANPTWYTDVRNTIYIGRTRSVYTETIGGGYFSQFHPSLQLTCPGYSRSVWSLPHWFAPRGRPSLSYHQDESRWDVQKGRVMLQSVAKGQEFVIDGSVYPELESWVRNLIRRYG